MGYGTRVRWSLPDALVIAAHILVILIIVSTMRF